MDSGELRLRRSADPLSLLCVGQCVTPGLLLFIVIQYFGDNGLHHDRTQLAGYQVNVLHDS